MVKTGGSHVLLCTYSKHTCGTVLLLTGGGYRLSEVCSQAELLPPLPLQIPSRLASPCATSKLLSWPPFGGGCPSKRQGGTLVRRHARMITVLDWVAIRVELSARGVAACHPNNTLLPSVPRGPLKRARRPMEQARGDPDGTSWPDDHRVGFGLRLVPDSTSASYPLRSLPM